MEHAQAFEAVKTLLTQGQLEQALQELVVLLDSNQTYAELAQAIRVNQADYFQIKSQVIRGTIASDDARLGYNQITNNALEVIQRIERGKTTLFDPAPARPARSVWRYYVIGGVLALGLAFAGWQLFGPKEECPTYGSTKTLRVMILPFKQIDEGTRVKREYDIMDGLNNFFENDFKLTTVSEADVNDAYDIDANYPNPSEALQIARNCGVEMIVWGRKRTTNDTVDVRYRLVNPLRRTVSNNADPALNQLLALSEEGSWSVDYRTATKLLYLVVASQVGASPMASNVLKNMPQPTLVSANVPMGDTIGLVSDPVQIDETTLLLKADLLRDAGKDEEALAIYDQVLEYNPSNTTALRIRGAMLYAKGAYVAASKDLEAVEYNPKTTSPALLKVRADAHLHAGQPDKARKDIETYSRQKSIPQDSSWLEHKLLQIADSTSALQQRAEEMERFAKSNPKNMKARLNAATAYLALGDEDAALKSAEKVRKLQPQNKEAVRVQVEALVEQGDTARAIDVLQRTGTSAKSVQFSPRVQRLKTKE